MTTSDYKTAQIATACWRAAPSELHSVMLAVCQVFINRAAAGTTDLYEEATKWLVDNPGDFPDTREPQFGQMLAKLDSVTSGMVSDKTGGALYFVPREKLTDLAEVFSVTTTIGNLVFIK